jgi:hypothetical protein
METPCLLQKEPSVLRNGLVVTKDMVERGCVHAIWMAALSGLIELLGVAKKDDGLRRLRHCQNVRKRHLGRLVDEEHVDRVARIRTCPKPSRPTCHLAIAMKS